MWTGLIINTDANTNRLTWVFTVGEVKKSMVLKTRIMTKCIKKRFSANKNLMMRQTNELIGVLM